MLQTQHLKQKCLLAFLLLTLSIFSLNNGNAKNNSTETDNPVQFVGAPNILIAQHPKLGAILTDSLGRTLYLYTRDAKKDTSYCVSAGCVAAWPIFYNANIALGNGLSAADFGVISRSDGKKQTTYKGWPLYYYVSDAAPGDVKGENVGTTWYVAKPDYSVMVMDNNLKGLDGITYTSKYVPGVERVKYFVDAYGRTLYAFSRDSLYKNKYTNSTFSNNATWPVYVDSVNSKVPTLVGDTLFKIIKVFGRKQLTYKGWPLYYFGRDTLRGQNRGVSFPVAGRWPVAVPSLGFAPAPPKVLLAQHPKLGAILTDSLGRTLYFFTRDAKKDTSYCVSAGCVATWPIFYKDNITLSTGLLASDFGTILRSDGKKQTTYKGWPLYYYVSDVAPGDVKGENVGTTWYVAKPDYSVMLMDNNLKGLDGITYTSKYVPGVERVKYFVDAYGRTLYFNSRDSLYKNKFTAANFSNNATWPIYPDTLGKKFATLVSDTLFKVINVFGRKQIAYKGWPLYYFGRDTLRGQTRGVSVGTPGRWPVAIPTIALAPTTAVTEVFRDKLSLVLSPKPTADYLQISLDSNISGDAIGTLYNLNGQIMQRIYFSLYQGNNQTRLDMSSLSSGLYFMALQINGQPAAYEKIIKQ
jgi:predicted lipoprotein with Yx(FWY)xxD motif